MRISLSEIPQSGLTVEGDIAPEEIDVHEVSFSIDDPIHLEFFLEVVDEYLIARGSYTARVRCTCDRCLKEFCRDRSRKDYLCGKEIGELADETIDLTEGVVEDILLGLPLKVLCSEDCKGICPYCGADLNGEECSCEPGPDISPFSELDKLL